MLDLDILYRNPHRPAENGRGRGVRRAPPMTKAHAIIARIARIARIALK